MTPGSDSQRCRPRRDDLDAARAATSATSAASGGARRASHRDASTIARRVDRTIAHAPRGSSAASSAARQREADGVAGTPSGVATSASTDRSRAHRSPRSTRSHSAATRRSVIPHVDRSAFAPAEREHRVEQRGQPLELMRRRVRERRDRGRRRVGAAGARRGRPRGSRDTPFSASFDVVRRPVERRAGASPARARRRRPARRSSSSQSVRSASSGAAACTGVASAGIGRCCTGGFT